MFVIYKPPSLWHSVRVGETGRHMETRENIRNMIPLTLNPNPTPKALFVKCVVLLWDPWCLLIHFQSTVNSLFSISLNLPFGFSISTLGPMLRKYPKRSNYLILLLVTERTLSEKAKQQKSDLGFIWNVCNLQHIIQKHKFWIPFCLFV